MTKRPDRGVIGTFVLTSLALLAFAGNSLLTRAALADHAIDAAAFAAIRLMSGAAMLSLLVLMRGGRALPGKADLPGIGALAAYAVAFSFAYNGLSAATGALILFACVQLGMAGYGLVRGQRFGGLELAGLCVAMGGLIWLLSPGLSAPEPLPALLMALAGFAWAAYTLLGRGASDPLPKTARNFVGAAPVGILFAIALPLHGVTVTGAGLAIASGAITSGIGYAIWYRALPALRPSLAGLAQLLVPVIAALGGALWLGEAPSLRFLIAGALILAGIALAIMDRGRSRQVPVGKN